MLKAEINKQVELVQVLLFLAKRNDLTMQSLENTEYCESIRKYFTPFENHAAVIKTRELIEKSYFAHGKPLRAILCLDEIISDSSHVLHEWGNMVQQFITLSDFDKFYASQSVYYDRILENINKCSLDAWIGFIENYFRQKPEIFKLMICPIYGNNGFNIGNTAYTVRCMPHYDDKGQANWFFDYFAKGIAHEYGHCFVNPVVENNKNLLDKHKDFFERHTNMYQFYNVNYAVINEYWVRAFAIRFMECNTAIFPDFNIADEYKRQREVFFAIDKFIDALKSFEKLEVSFSDFYLSNIDNILNTAV